MPEVSPNRNPHNLFVAYEVQQKQPILDDDTWNQHCKASVTLIAQLDHSTTPVRLYEIKWGQNLAL